MEVELWEDWHVGDHDDDEEVVVVEGDIEGVGEWVREELGAVDVGQRMVDGEQLARHAQWVQYDEQRVPGPFDGTWEVLEKTEGVE